MGQKTPDLAVKAVLRVLAGESTSEVAAELGLAPQDLERWRERFVAAGRRALATVEHAEQPPLRVRLELLGVPRVCSGDRVLEWRLRRAFEVVAFLAMAEEQRATKAQLVTELWGEASHETVRKNFHPTFSEARRTLALGLPENVETLVYSSGYYALSAEVEWSVDTFELEDCDWRVRQLAREGRASEGLEIGLCGWGLYRGPFLPDLDSPWAKRRRLELRRRYLALLWQVGKLSEAVGREQTALDAYRAVLIEEPLEELGHQAVMRLYGAQGRRDLVRRQFVRLQERLEDLNVEPMQSTQELYHELMG